MLIYGSSLIILYLFLLAFLYFKKCVRRLGLILHKNDFLPDINLFVVHLKYQMIIMLSEI